MMHKLKSRKFLLTLFTQIAGLFILFYPEHEDQITQVASQAGGLLLMTLTAYGWIKAEGQVDAVREAAKQEKESQNPIEVGHPEDRLMHEAFERISTVEERYDNAETLTNYAIGNAENAHKEAKKASFNAKLAIDAHDRDKKLLKDYVNTEMGRQKTRLKAADKSIKGLQADVALNNETSQELMLQIETAVSNAETARSTAASAIGSAEHAVSGQKELREAIDSLNLLSNNLATIGNLKEHDEFNKKALANQQRNIGDLNERVVELEQMAKRLPNAENLGLDGQGLANKALEEVKGMAARQASNVNELLGEMETRIIKTRMNVGDQVKRSISIADSAKESAVEALARQDAQAKSIQELTDRISAQANYLQEVGEVVANLHSPQVKVPDPLDVSHPPSDGEVLFEENAIKPLDQPEQITEKEAIAMPVEDFNRLSPTQIKNSKLPSFLLAGLLALFMSGCALLQPVPPASAADQWFQARSRLNTANAIYVAWAKTKDIENPEDAAEILEYGSALQSVRVILDELEVKIGKEGEEGNVDTLLQALEQALINLETRGNEHARSSDIKAHRLRLATSPSGVQRLTHVLGSKDQRGCYLARAA